MFSTGTDLHAIAGGLFVGDDGCKGGHEGGKGEALVLIVNVRLEVVN